MALCKQTSNRFDILEQPSQFILANYVWICTTGKLLRCKSRTLDYEPLSPDDLPWWDCVDAFSVGYINTDHFVKPVRIYNDPFFDSAKSNKKNKLILCENYKYDKSISDENKRQECLESVNKLKALKQTPLFIVEQIYTMMDKDGIEPLDQHLLKNSYTSSKLPKNFHYCSIGIDKVSGRNLAECHYKACLYAGINIRSFNNQSSISEWKFEIGPCEPTALADDLVMARYILHRLAEEFDVVIQFEKCKTFNSDSNHLTKIYFSINETIEENIFKNMISSSKLADLKANFSNKMILLNNRINNGLSGVIKFNLGPMNGERYEKSKEKNGNRVEFLDLIDKDLNLMSKNGLKSNYINCLNGNIDKFNKNNLTCFVELLLNETDYNFEPYLLVSNIINTILLDANNNNNDNDNLSNSHNHKNNNSSTSI